MKVDKDEVVSIDQHTSTVSPAARDGASGASVIVLSDSDSEETEVRSKLERTTADSVIGEAVNSAADDGGGGGDSRKEEGLKGRSLFYLTRVRGIGAHYNHSNVATGIRGKVEMILLVFLT